MAVMTVRGALRDGLVTNDIINEWFVRYPKEGESVPLNPLESEARENRWVQLFIFAMAVLGLGVVISLYGSKTIGISLAVLSFGACVVIFMTVIAGPDEPHVVFLEEWFALRDMLSTGKKVSIDDYDVLGQASEYLLLLERTINDNEKSIERERLSTEISSIDFLKGLVHCQWAAMKTFVRLYQLYDKFATPPCSRSFYDQVKRSLERFDT